MAVNFQTTFKSKAEYLLTQSTQFRRGDAQVKTKKVQRKLKLKHKHVAFSFFLLVGFFLFVQQSYLFLITWSNLEIDKLEIQCRKPDIQIVTEQFLAKQDLGNILLLDIGSLRTTIETHRWIEKVHIRKKFPSTLKIEIQERIPAAILKKGCYILIDGYGEELEYLESETDLNIPLLIDRNNFKINTKEKLHLAWDCLDDLSASQKDKIKTLDLSEYENVKLRQKESDTWIKLGIDQFSEKLRLYQEELANLEKYGTLEYVDMRIQDRIYFKPKIRLADSMISSPGKEE
jgi:cell division septal protein FtsQ